MADRFDSQFLDDPEFQSLVVACLESLERGNVIDRDALARDYPKYASEVGQFLEDRQLLRQVAKEFGDVEPSRVAITAYDKTMDSNSPRKDFTTGDIVRYIGEYEILEEIARGGMGVVFKARQQKLHRIVALKMILAGRLADTADVERFQREARAAGRLKHPNIVPVHEIGEHEGRHYFTMDFVEGRSLAEEIREESLAPRSAAAILQTVAKAVHFAHEQGTVHRDLKPANILLTPDNEPHITDFGLAKMLASVDEESRAELTASGQILGTPSYMSPEQASGKQELVGPASDIYSLGAVLYACLTGRAPFVADSPVDTLLQVMKKEPVSPRELNPSVPRDLETICLKCLEKEPHKRYGTAQKLAEDLRRFLEDRPILARPADFSEKTIRWCRRNPAIASLLFLVLISMATGTIVSVYYASQANYRAQVAISAKQLAERARENEQKMRKGAEMMSEFAMTQQSHAQLARDLAEQQRQNAEAERLAAIKARDAEAEARQDAERVRARAELLFNQEAEARMQAERAERDVVRSLYVARTHLTRLLWERGDKWGASLPHVEQFFNNDLTIADSDPAIELETLNHMVAAAPSDDFLHFLRGIYYAKRRQWKESFADLELASNLTSNQYWYHCEAASVALMVENHEAYDRHVQSLVNHVKGPEETDVLSGANVALIAALRPQALEVLAELLPFTERWASSRSNQFFRMKSLILVRLRLGEYEAVLKLLEPFSEDTNFYRTEHIVLASSIRALALYHLDRSEEAKRELESAVTTSIDRLHKEFVVRDGSLQATHHPFIQAHVLLSEAKNRVGPEAAATAPAMEAIQKIKE